MKYLRLLLYTFFCVCTSSCATMVTSANLEEKVTFEEKKKITHPLHIVLKRTFRWGNRQPSPDSFSEKNFATEIDTIKRSNIFEYPLFVESNPTSGEPFVEFKIARYWDTDGCYMGGCLFIPGQRVSQYDVLMNVYNSQNQNIFEHRELITGEERKAGWDFSLGWNPIDSVRTRGLPLVINKCLLRFVSSEAFKKLTQPGK